MDWSSDDYSRVYADTFLTPAPETGTGVYLLDEAGRDTDPYDRDRLEAPIRRYGPKGPPRRPPAGPRREGFFGNVISDRGNTRAVFDVAWDERPLHFNPHSGTDWAHLVPPPSAHRGPPAFPLITRSEAANNPGAVQLPGAPSKECFGGGACGHPAACSACGRSTELNLQYLKVFLLIVIVVLLALTLMAAGRLARSLEKTVRTAVGLLGAVAVGGRPAQ
jgi:hypothetical protein